MNRMAFESYIETQLAPVLKDGDVVILDNLSSHKGEAAERLVRAKGAWLLFLPASRGLGPAPLRARPPQAWG